MHPPGQRQHVSGERISDSFSGLPIGMRASDCENEPKMRSPTHAGAVLVERGTHHEADEVPDARGGMACENHERDVVEPFQLDGSGGLGACV